MIVAGSLKAGDCPVPDAGGPSITRADGHPVANAGDPSTMTWDNRSTPEGDVHPMSRVEASLDLLRPEGPVPPSEAPFGLDAAALESALADGPEPYDPLEEPALEKKSPALAAIYSLLLPGMGELYAGGFSSGKYFLMAEGALWLTYGAFTLHGSSQQDDARAYALSRAGIDPAGKDDQFYVDIGNFMTTEDFNEKQLRDRQPELLYSRAEGEGWTWESDPARQAYKDERLSSEHTYNNRKFIVAAILVNHIASAINAARVAVAHNSALDRALGELSFGASVLGGIHQPHGLLLTVRRGI